MGSGILLLEAFELFCLLLDLPKQYISLVLSYCFCRQLHSIRNPQDETAILPLQQGFGLGAEAPVWRVVFCLRGASLVRRAWGLCGFILGRLLGRGLCKMAGTQSSLQVLRSERVKSPLV